MYNERLIKLVKSYSFLYNQKDRSYRDNNRKDAAWDAIGKILNQPAEDCKKQWNRLRDRFRRSMKKRRDMKSGQATNKITKWRHADEMSFLTPYIKRKEAIVHEADDADPAKEQFNSNFQVRDVPIETIREKIRERETTSTILTNDHTSNSTNKIATIEQPIIDDTDIFFRSVALTVKKLSAYNQLIAKTRISFLISELQLQEFSNVQRQPYTSDSINLSVISTPTSLPHAIELPQMNNSEYPSTSYAASNYYRNIS